MDSGLDDHSLHSFGLWSASGESGAEAESSTYQIAAGAKRPTAEPKTEARRNCGILRMLTRDERAV